MIFQLGVEMLMQSAQTTKKVDKEVFFRTNRVDAVGTRANTITAFKEQLNFNRRQKKKQKQMQGFVMEEEKIWYDAIVKLQSGISAFNLEADTEDEQGSIGEGKGIDDRSTASENQPQYPTKQTLNSSSVEIYNDVQVLSKSDVDKLSVKQDGVFFNRTNPNPKPSPAAAAAAAPSLCVKLPTNPTPPKNVQTPKSNPTSKIMKKHIATIPVTHDDKDEFDFDAMYTPKSSNKNPNIKTKNCNGSGSRTENLYQGFAFSDSSEEEQLTQENKVQENSQKFHVFDDDDKDGGLDRFGGLKIKSNGDDKEINAAAADASFTFNSEDDDLHSLDHLPLCFSQD